MKVGDIFIFNYEKIEESFGFSRSYLDNTYGKYHRILRFRGNNTVVVFRPSHRKYEFHIDIKFINSCGPFIPLQLYKRVDLYYE